MKQYLALKLQGVMQAWGGHTYEDLRHTELIPTRSGVLGLLAACMGIDRKDTNRLESLASSVKISVRIDTDSQRMTDFHTVLDARKVDGKANKFPVVSRREYLCDATFTVLLKVAESTGYSLQQIADATEKPVYTPFLGRRACALSRPLFEGFVEAIDEAAAFSLIEPFSGAVYSDTKPEFDSTTLRLRDVPLYARKRQFSSRQLYIYNLPKQEASHVPN